MLKVLRFAATACDFGKVHQHAAKYVTNLIMFGIYFQLEILSIAQAEVKSGIRNRYLHETRKIYCYLFEI